MCSTASAPINASNRSKSRVFQASTNDWIKAFLAATSVSVASRVVPVMITPCSNAYGRHRTDAGTARKVRELSGRRVHPCRMGAVEVTDAELATLARAGDAQAVAGLLERHRPALYAAAIGVLGNRADALDAVQDTNVVALLRIGELREAAAAKRWLHTVLRNVCLMRLRQRREVPSEHV